MIVNIREFLETSSIHGLSHIYRTKKELKLFWILTVFSGFSAAGILIYQSFDAWSVSPIRTTIETLPIAEIKLPKVTVCPPKNIHTDLNHVLKRTENMAISSATREDLIHHVLELILEPFYEDLMFNISLLNEENRYYNWFHGITDLNLPYWDGSILKYELNTYAFTGAICTKYYGKKFEAKKIERKIHYLINVLLPSDSSGNEKWFEENKNVSLYFEVDIDPLQNLDLYEINNTVLNVTASSMPMFNNFTPPQSHKFSAKRIVSLDDVNGEKLGIMPGFKIKWHYNANLTKNIYSYTDDAIPTCKYAKYSYYYYLDSACQYIHDTYDDKQFYYSFRNYNDYFNR